jgi:hypothetical protein
MKKIQQFSFVLLAVLMTACGQESDELEYSPPQAVMTSGPSEESQTFTLEDFDVSVEWMNILLSEYIEEQRDWFQNRHGPVLSETNISLDQSVGRAEVVVRDGEIIRMSSLYSGTIETFTRSSCEEDEYHREYLNCAEFPEEPAPTMDRRGNFYLSMDNFLGNITYWIVFQEDDQWWLIETEGDWNDEHGFNPESSFSLPTPA